MNNKNNDKNEIKRMLSVCVRFLCAREMFILQEMC